jgi:aminomethyltransferase
MNKCTPLHAAHKRLGGKLIEFGGWDMPVQYTSIVDEHLIVRQSAGIFDISHMGEVSVCGPAAAEFLNATLTNDIRKLASGQGQYTLMCNPRGGVIDDLYVYCLNFCGDGNLKQAINPDGYMLIINASRIEADVAWLKQKLAEFPGHGEVELSNCSDIAAAVAVQGPKVRSFIDEVFTGPSKGGMKVAKASDLKKNQIGCFGFGKEFAWVASTGYTGEDGFEIVATNEQIGPIWDALLTAGAKPCGLGARDTLRTEVCYPLYGHELNEGITPIEAGVSFAVTLDKEFIGRSPLSEQKVNGPARKCVAFKMTEKSAPPRPHYPIWSVGPEAKVIGEVTSGTQSPSLNVGIGLGYVPAAFAKSDTKIEIEIRGRRCPAVVVAKPIYRKQA